MARRTIYRSNSLNLSNPPDGYFYVGYEGVTFSQLDDEGNITPIGGTGAGGVGSSGTSGTSGFDGTSIGWKCRIKFKLCKYQSLCCRNI
jgi:hypothetical protein